jgi:hypothetical protein
MADMERLLSGSDLGQPDRLFAPEGAHADRLAEARGWCQTTPDHDAIQWLAASLGAKRRLRKATDARRDGA